MLGYEKMPVKGQICTHEGCEKPVAARGLCGWHYEQAREKTRTARCSVEGCTRIAYVGDQCKTHYRRRFRLPREAPSRPPQPAICSVEGCDRETMALGYCQLHYQRLKRHGSVELQPPESKPKLICTVDGCGRPAHGHGLCQSHLRSKRRAEQAVVKSVGSPQNIPTALLLRRLSASAKQAAEELGLINDRRALRYAARHEGSNLQVKALRMFRKDEDERQKSKSYWEATG